MQPILWSFRRCPYAMRARLAIQASGVAVELREILLRDKPAAFVAKSPKATVPILELADGMVLEESRDIIFWALAQNDPEDWLACWHKDRGRVEAFLDALDGPFKTHLDRYKYASRYARQSGVQEADKVHSDNPESETPESEERKHRTAGSKFLREINDALGAESESGGSLSGTALSGAALGLMDYACLPFVRQFRIADPLWFDAQPWPYLHSWLAAFLEGNKFASVMTKYEPWQTGQQGVDFPA